MVVIEFTAILRVLTNLHNITNVIGNLSFQFQGILQGSNTIFPVVLLGSLEAGKTKMRLSNFKKRQ